MIGWAGGDLLYKKDITTIEWVKRGGCARSALIFLNFFLIFYTADGFDPVTNKYLDLVDGWLTIPCCVLGHDSRISCCEDFRGSNN